MATVAVTGATGFIGRHLCRALEKNGLTVRRLTRRTGTGLCTVNYHESNSLASALDGVDVVYHLAGLINGASALLKKANVTTTEKIVEASKTNGVLKLIYVSSAAAAMLKGEYGRLKRKAEEIVEKSGIDYLIFRPTLVYGAGDNKNVATIAETIKFYPVVPVLGGGHFKVQPVYIDDAISVLVQALDRQVPEKIYNISGPAQVSLLNMILLISKHMKRRRLLMPIPLKPIQRALSIYQKIFPKTKLPVKQVLELDKHEAFDISDTRRDFDFNPRLFDEGIRLTISEENR